MRKHTVPYKRLEIVIPEALYLQLSLFLPHDARTGKTAHGEWSRLVQRLFNEELNRRANNGTN